MESPCRFLRALLSWQLVLQQESIYPGRAILFVANQRRFARHCAGLVISVVFDRF
jgi:hypothetical protein